MKTLDLRQFIQEYWGALSGKPKPLSVLKEYISDDEFIQHVLVYEKAFPKYELVADDFICEDDKVAIRARVKGTHSGDLMGIPPTGKTIEVPLSVIYQVKDNKVTNGWLFIDQMELMQQLGLS